MSEIKQDANKKGLLVVVSGPSGVGKGTVLSKVLESSDEYVYSVSATTREPREGDKDGVNYFFISKQEFEKRIKEDKFLEYAEYNGNYYGTPKDYVEKKLAEGKNVFLEIEVQGAMQIKTKCPDAFMVFIAPESKEALIERLKGRATETQEAINNRIKIAERELRACLIYDRIAINETGKIDECAADVMAAVRAEKLKPERIFDKIKQFIQ